MTKRPSGIPTFRKVRGQDAYRALTPSEKKAAVKRLEQLERRKQCTFVITMRSNKPLKEIEGLAITAQADLVYNALGEVADRLVELGIPPDLVAQAVYDLGHKLVQLDGSPVRVARTPMR